MSHERLTATDASFLYIESPREPQHVGSLSILEGAPLRDASGRIRFEEIRHFVERRLHRVPRMRQRVRMVPLRQGRPVWDDDDRFDLDYHVRLTALPRPGTRDQLLELMGRLQSLMLDRTRPLWELWLVDGLEDGNVAQIVKTHHAIGDGIANVDMMMALVDLEATPPSDPPAPRWVPSPPPSDAELLRHAIAAQVVRPAAVARNAAAAFRSPAGLVSTLRDLASATTMLRDTPEPASWNTQVGSHRRWVNATASIDDVRRIRVATDCGATLNDVVLAACSSALRSFLIDHGESVDAGRHLKAMVPVSLRQDAEHGNTLGNKVSLIVVDLPVHEPDPVRCLESICAQTTDLKHSGMADGAEVIVGLAGEVPMLAPSLAKAVAHNIPMNLVITNVPGPPVPLWMYGSKVLEVFPYVEVIDGEGLTIAVVSYENELHFGVTADRDAMPDLTKLAGAIERGFADLQSAAAPREEGV